MAICESKIDIKMNSITYCLWVALMMPITNNGSNDVSIVGNPIVKFQCHGCAPYNSDPPWRRLKVQKFHGTNTHLQET